MRSIASFTARLAVALLATSPLAACGARSGLPTAHIAAIAPTAQSTSVFTSVLARVKASAAANHHPIVIFDLDDTLFRTAPRNQAILKAWLATPNGKPFAARASDISLADLGWGIDTALAKLGVPADVQATADQFWAARFFTSDFLKFDRPNPGAQHFVQEAARAGARIVYLTGRMDPDMRAGTEAALQTNGFPWDPSGSRVTLELKADKTIPDVTFKATQASALAQEGEVIASFDNEPANVNMFHHVLPDAATVFLESVHSPNAVPVDAGIAEVLSFPRS